MIKLSVHNPPSSAAPHETREPACDQALTSQAPLQDALEQVVRGSTPASASAPVAIPTESGEVRRKRVEVTGYFRLFDGLPKVIADLQLPMPQTLQAKLSDIATLAAVFCAREHRGLDALHTAASAHHRAIYDAVQEVRYEPLRSLLNWELTNTVGDGIGLAQPLTAPPPPPQVPSGRYKILYDVDNDRYVAIDNQGRAVTDPATLRWCEAELNRLKADSSAKVHHLSMGQPAASESEALVKNYVAEQLTGNAARPRPPMISGSIAQRDPYCHPVAYFIALALMDQPEIGPLARNWLTHNDSLFETALGIGQTDKPKVQSRWCQGPRPPCTTVREVSNRLSGRQQIMHRQATVSLYGLGGAASRAATSAMFQYDAAAASFSAHNVVMSTYAALSQEFLYETHNLMPPRKKTVCVDPEGKVLPAVLLADAVAALHKAQDHLGDLTAAEQAVVASLRELAQVAETMDRESRAGAVAWTQVAYLLEHMPKLAELVRDVDKHVAQVDAMLANRVALTKKQKKLHPKPSPAMQQLRAEIGVLAHQADMQGATSAVAANTVQAPAREPYALGSTSVVGAQKAFAVRVANIVPTAVSSPIALGKALRFWTRLPSAAALKDLISACCDAATFRRFDDAADWQAKARCLAYHMDKHADPQTPVEDYLQQAFTLYETDYNNELAPRIGGRGDWVRVVRTQSHVGVYGWDGAFINYYVCG